MARGSSDIFDLNELSYGCSSNSITRKRISFDESLNSKNVNGRVLKSSPVCNEDEFLLMDRKRKRTPDKVNQKMSDTLVEKPREDMNNVVPKFALMVIITDYSTMEKCDLFRDLITFKFIKMAGLSYKRNMRLPLPEVFPQRNKGEDDLITARQRDQNIGKRSVQVLPEAHLVDTGELQRCRRDSQSELFEDTCDNRNELVQLPESNLSVKWGKILTQWHPIGRTSSEPKNEAGSYCFDVKSRKSSSSKLLFSASLLLLIACVSGSNVDVWIDSNGIEPCDNCPSGRYITYKLHIEEVLKDIFLWRTNNILRTFFAQMDDLDYNYGIIENDSIIVNEFDCVSLFKQATEFEELVTLLRNPLDIVYAQNAEDIYSFLGYNYNYKLDTKEILKGVDTDETGEINIPLSARVHYYDIDIIKKHSISVKQLLDYFSLHRWSIRYLPNINRHRLSIRYLSNINRSLQDFVDILEQIAEDIDTFPGRYITYKLHIEEVLKDIFLWRTNNILRTFFAQMDDLDYNYGIIENDSIIVNEFDCVSLFKQATEFEELVTLLRNPLDIVYAQNAEDIYSFLGYNYNYKLDTKEILKGVDTDETGEINIPLSARVHYYDIDIIKKHSISVKQLLDYFSLHRWSIRYLPNINRHRLSIRYLSNINRSLQDFVDIQEQIAEDIDTFPGSLIPDSKAKFRKASAIIHETHDYCSILYIIKNGGNVFLEEFAEMIGCICLFGIGYLVVSLSKTKNKDSVCREKEKQRFGTEYNMLLLTFTIAMVLIYLMIYERSGKKQNAGKTLISILVYARVHPVWFVLGRCHVKFTRSTDFKSGETDVILDNSLRFHRLPVICYKDAREEVAVSKDGIIGVYGVVNISAVQNEDKVSPSAVYSSLSLSNRNVKTERSLMTDTVLTHSIRGNGNTQMYYNMIFVLFVCYHLAPFLIHDAALKPNENKDEDNSMQEMDLSIDSDVEGNSKKEIDTSAALDDRVLDNQPKYEVEDKYLDCSIETEGENSNDKIKVRAKGDPCEEDEAEGDRCDWLEVGKDMNADTENHSELDIDNVEFDSNNVEDHEGDNEDLDNTVDGKIVETSNGENDDDLGCMKEIEQPDNQMKEIRGTSLGNDCDNDDEDNNGGRDDDDSDDDDSAGNDDRRSDHAEKNTANGAAKNGDDDNGDDNATPKENIVFHGNYDNIAVEPVHDVISSADVMTDKVVKEKTTVTTVESNEASFAWLFNLAVPDIYQAEYDKSTDSFSMSNVLKISPELVWCPYKLLIMSRKSLYKRPLKEFVSYTEVNSNNEDITDGLDQCGFNVPAISLKKDGNRNSFNMEDVLFDEAVLLKSEDDFHLESDCLKLSSRTSPLSSNQTAGISLLSNQITDTENSCGNKIDLIVQEPTSHKSLIPKCDTFEDEEKRLEYPCCSKMELVVQDPISQRTDIHVPKYELSIDEKGMMKATDHKLQKKYTATELSSLMNQYFEENPVNMSPGNDMAMEDATGNMKAKLGSSNKEHKLRDDPVLSTPMIDSDLNMVEIRNVTSLIDLPTPKIDMSYLNGQVYRIDEPMLSVIARLASPNPPTPHVSMRYELLRFCTLRTYPKGDKPYLIKLAAAGFYYASDGDGVVCYCCGIRRYNWNGKEDPMKVHKGIKPHCKFLLRNEENNVPVVYNGPWSRGLMAIDNIPVPHSARQEEGRVNMEYAPDRLQHSQETPTGQQTLGINNSTPKHPSYVRKDQRLTSYKDWPRDAKLKPDILASAGFYHAGFGDCVRCFYCGVGLRHWSAEDDPWVEHARWARTCVFVRQKKGVEFVDLVQMAVQYTQDNGAAMAGDTSNGLPVTVVEKLLLSTGALQAAEMGFNTGLIRQAVDEFISKGVTNVRSEELLNAIIRIDAEKKKATTGGAKGSSDEIKPGSDDFSEKSSVSKATKLEAHAVSSDKGKNSTKDTNNKASKNKNSESVQDPQAIKNENEKLKEQTLCKVCLDNSVSIVFLPCGHLVTCADCAPAMRKCPICRALVKGTVRTYMS
ncbi:Baculoviral IAP repeat-containing protein 2 [Mactra antiquata]